MRKPNLVSWDFLYYTMARLGFYARWVEWIKECLESSSISILVNGSPTKEFVTTRGLKQGDPMKHFLFLIVAKNLLGMVKDVVKKNLYCGVEFSYNRTKVGYFSCRCVMLKFKI